MRTALVAGLGAAVLALAPARAALAAGYCGDVWAGEPVLAQSGIASALNWGTVRAFYDDKGGACAWDEHSGQALISAVGGAPAHGLDGELFHLSALSAYFGSQDGREQAAADLLLTDAAIKYARAMTRGLSAPPTAVEDEAAGARPNGDLIDALSRTLADDNVATWLDGLPPKAAGYEQLRAALATYQAVAAAGGWESLPQRLALRPGKKSTLVPLLKRRLEAEGDLAFNDGTTLFDEAVVEAVKRFQSRNGLDATGKLNRATIERLNVSASERVAQIAVNLERWRVHGRDLAPTRVEVNVPGATAVLMRDGMAVLAMNAVVGAPGHDTPMLMSAINQIVLNPSWTIPRSIVEHEIRPLLKRDPDYLIKNRMYWSGDLLVQEPGPQNALGRIKFEFPNRYSVYLHDTPARKLFTSPERAQSHGCVRLESPLDLAVELLKDDPAWTREAIEQAIRDGATLRVPVPEEIPVVISYWTAFVGEDGLVQFRPDVYGRDTQLTLALSEKVAGMRAEPAQW